MSELIAPVIPAGRLCARPQPTLAAGPLVLRPWSCGDVEVLVEAYADPAIRQWHVRSMTDAEALEWVRERSDRWSAETGVDWAVADGGQVIGRVGFKAFDLDEGQAEAAYWVLPSARGRGVAGRALRAASAWMFARAGFHRLALTHSTDNKASCRVADRAGYRFEGTQRKQGRHADGWHDMHLHACLAEDLDPT